MTDSPELNFLRNEVARVFGGRLQASTDFEALSDAIEAKIHKAVSVSTLKRLWGYAGAVSRPRKDTLDRLSLYTGRGDYAAVCTELQETSSFLSDEHIRAAELLTGTNLELQWLPDRRVKLKYLGHNRFRVLDGGSSKLRTGDEFDALEFLKCHPLYLNGLTRGGKLLPDYVAGRSGGLTGLTVITAARL